MTMMTALPRRNLRLVPVLESLFWPVHPLGIAGAARRSLDAWMVDLLRAGVHIGARVSFAVEDVVDRFKLCVQADGSFCTDPPCIPPWSGLTFVSDEGDTADSLDGLVASCWDAPPWRFPLEYVCRVVQPYPRTEYELTYTGFEPRGAARG